jgi:hypothetical protein
MRARTRSRGNSQPTGPAPLSTSTQLASTSLLAVDARAQVLDRLEHHGT